MEIKRTLNTDEATYDLIGLTHRQFSHLLQSYEKQWYMYCNRAYPEKVHDPLLDAMRELDGSRVTIIRTPTPITNKDNLK